ncbi:hypothetical protein PoB_001333700 [Plakobranchus ocellatus]|uniref:Uncharacterized protein n=1 Tax=Plakobranchus ocellatus TaxID=259542 RepID=A0AAV3YWW0_9GAST|nr:hypothetical protein PoB_001333700 [Plakobranchus ocellatus]
MESQTFSGKCFTVVLKPKKKTPATKDAGPYIFGGLIFRDNSGDKAADLPRASDTRKLIPAAYPYSCWQKVMKKMPS